MPLAELGPSVTPGKVAASSRSTTGNLGSSYAAWLDDHDRAAGRLVPIPFVHADPALVVAEKPKDDMARTRRSLAGSSSGVSAR